MKISFCIILLALAQIALGDFKEVKVSLNLEKLNNKDSYLTFLKKAYNDETPSYVRLYEKKYRKDWAIRGIERRTPKISPHTEKEAYGLVVYLDEVNDLGNEEWALSLSIEFTIPNKNVWDFKVIEDYYYSVCKKVVIHYTGSIIKTEIPLSIPLEQSRKNLARLPISIELSPKDRADSTR